MRVVAIDHVVLPVDDVEAALAFYCGVLGMEGVRVDLWRAGRVPFASVRAGGALLDLMAGGSAPPLDHVCLRVEGPIEQVVAALEAAGVAVAKGPVRRYGAQGDGMSVYVRDPAGNAIELKCDGACPGSWPDGGS
jgi:catechol 2,3-dioxygenase-like lactoylglutathione lyase family enzyme